MHVFERMYSKILDWPEDSEENGPLRIIALKCPRVKNGEIKVIFCYIVTFASIECICLEMNVFTHYTEGKSFYLEPISILVSVWFLLKLKKFKTLLCSA